MRGICVALLSLILLLTGVPSLAGPKLKVKDLTPSERAFYLTFLGKKPRLKTRDNPISIATHGVYTENEWANGLTEDSFDRLQELVPDLAERVREGQQFRKEHIERIIQATDSYWHDQEKFERNAAARLRASYFHLLRQQRQNASQQDKQRIEVQAIELARARFRYPTGLPMRDWDREATQYYLKKKRELEEQEELPDKPQTLSPSNFQMWRKAELDRLQRRTSRAWHLVEEVPLDLTKLPLTLNYVRSAFRVRAVALSDAEETLRKFTDPKLQDKLLVALSERQLAEDKNPDELVAQRWFGGPSRTGGIETSLRDPKLAWVYDLGWRGYKEGWDKYWERWRKKSSRWTADARQVLDPERYRSERRERFRNAAARKLGTAAVGALYSLVVGGGLALMGAGLDSLMVITNRKPVATFALADWALDKADRIVKTEFHFPHLTLGLPQLSLGLPHFGGSGSGSGGGQNEASGRPATGAEPEAQSGESRDYRENNSEEGVGQVARPLFRVRPLAATRLEALPVEFSVPFVEEASAGKNTVHNINVEEAGPPEFEVDTGKPFVPADRLVPVTGADGYRVIPIVESEGKRLAPGDDYDFVTTERGTHFIKFRSAFPPSQIHYRAQFFPGAAHSSSAPQANWEPPPIPKAKLEKMAPLLEEAGFGKIASGVRELASQEKVTARDLESLMSQRAYYSRVPAMRLATIDPAHPFLAYHVFSFDDTATGDCDVDNGILKQMLKIGFEDHPTIQVDMESLLVRDPEQSELTSHNKHGRLQITDSRYPGAIQKIDGTAVENDPRNPEVKREVSERRTEPEVPRKPPVPSKPPRLARRKYEDMDHKLVFRGRDTLALHEEEDEEPTEKKSKPPESEPKSEEAKTTKPEVSTETAPAASATATTTAPQPKPEIDHEAEARRFAQQELAARQARNQARRELLRQLHAHKKVLIPALQTYQPTDAFSGADVPHQQVFDLARLLEKYLAGEMGRDSLERKLGGSDKPESLRSRLNAIGSRLRDNVKLELDNMKARQGKGRFPDSLIEHIVQPAQAMADFIARADWTPFEDESYPTILADCRARFGLLAH